MATLTREQLQSRKEKAVRFAENVLDDPGRAREIEAESLDDYADRRGVTLINGRSLVSRRGRVYRMRARLVNPQADKLLDRIAKLEEEVRNGKTARRKKATRTNPERAATVSPDELKKLQEENKKLQEANEDLQDKLDRVAELAAAPEDGRAETKDDLVDDLNDILDIVGDEDEEDDDSANGDGDDEDDEPGERRR